VKRKTFSILITVALIAGLSLIPAAPAGANGGTTTTLTVPDNVYRPAEFVTSSTTTNSGTAYTNVRFNITISGPEAFIGGRADTFTITKVNGSSDTQGINDTFVLVGGDWVGYWGPETGFPLSDGYNETSTFTTEMCDITTAPLGDYDVTVELVDLTPNPDVTLATATDSFSLSADALYVGTTEYEYQFNTIQSAITAASDNDTVSVAAGTYDEQVVIEKSLTLQGAGDTTTVKPSSKDKLATILDAVGPYYPKFGMRQVAGIIVANDAANVTVKNLKVDGASIDALPAHDPAVYAVVGILYRESGGTIDNVTVDNLLGVMSLSVYLSAATETVSVEVKNSTLINFQKNGLDACGDHLTANIHHNIITGEGDEYDTQCQNGVIVAIGTEATVDNNTISDVNYPSINTLSIAILFHSSHGSADNNTITDCNSGVWAEDSNLSAEGNTITLPGTKWGCNGLVARLYGVDGCPWTGDYGFRDGDWTVSFVGNTVTGTFEQGVGIACKDNALDTSSLTVTLDGNHLTGSGSEVDYPWDGGFGIQIGDSSGQNTVAPVDVTITDNEFTNWVRGIDIDDLTPPDDTIITITGNTIQNNTGTDCGGICLGPARVDATKVEVHYNNISGNTYGVKNVGTGTLDATHNYWGDALDGPTHTSNPDGTGDEISDDVDYVPWIYFTTAANGGDTVAHIVANEVPAYVGLVVLGTGWNTFSTPIGLDGQYNTWKELYDLTSLDYSMAYRFDTASQTFVSLGHTNTYALAPGEGFYIKMNSADSIPCCISTQFSMPSRDLKEGWDMIGGGVEDRSEVDSCISIAESGGTAGYTHIISPWENAGDPWVYIAGAAAGSEGNFVAGEGYWVFLAGDRTLGLFDSTPLPWEAP